MYKKVLISILVLLLLVVVIMALFYFFKKSKSVDNKKELSVYLFDIDEDIEIDDYVVFQDYNFFKEKIRSDVLKEEDFIDSDYLVFRIMYDSCSEENIEPMVTLSENNDVNVVVNYKAKCGLCAPEYLYYYVKLSKNMVVNGFNLNYKQTNKIDCPTNVAYKPIIYLYPEVDMKVRVKFLNSFNLTTTYPRYNDGWEVFARADGTLVDENNREYYGLYWEGINHHFVQKEEGFVVQRDNIISFLEEKLDILGLNEREANEFIIYWLPILEKSEYNYIYFETNEEINNYMPLYIEPEPDSIIRILMNYKPLDEKISVLEQQLSTPKRYGFTVVEWGGSKID